MIHQTLCEVRDGEGVRVRLRNNLVKQEVVVTWRRVQRDKGAKHVNRTCQQYTTKAKTEEDAGHSGNTEERPPNS